MIYLSLGSNLGNRLENIRKAVSLLKNVFTGLRVSPVLETEAIRPAGASDEWNKPFLNAIASGESKLQPAELLTALQAMEAKLGRPKARKKWEPRIIDLDILLWDDRTIAMPSLVVPHPELCNRPFLLHLLAMDNPYLRYPGGKTFAELAAGYAGITDCFSRAFALQPQLVGVVNVTPDSFSDGGKYFSHKQAIERALELAQTGAAVVEVGAQSTRPGAQLISAEQELDRLAPVLDGLLPEMKAGAIAISIDTFYPAVVRKILERYPISWINDVKNNFDDATLKEIKNSGCKLAIMHSLSIPAKGGESLDWNKAGIDEVIGWGADVVKRLLELGFEKDSIVLDPGIGFGKFAYQSLALIKVAEQIKKLGCAVMIGHSRKSYISSFSKLPAAERDLETVAVSDCLSECGIDYLRVHNVADHHRFFVAKQLIKAGVHV